jgi:predicted transposase YdaD
LFVVYKEIANRAAMKKGEKKAEEEERREKKTKLKSPAGRFTLPLRSHL